MTNEGVLSNKSLEQAIQEILKSRATSKIYLYLLRKHGAKADQVIKGAHLHPSTVRELLAKMYEQKLIYRKKLKTDKIGKNPYVYYSISPLLLIKRYSKEIEDRLNKIARLANFKQKDEDYNPVKIKISEEAKINER
jgi:predicted DNA-binding transcriptional regulator